MNHFVVGGMALSGASAILYGIVRYVSSFDSQISDSRDRDSQISYSRVNDSRDTDHDMDCEPHSECCETCDDTTCRSTEAESMTEDGNKKCICAVLRSVECTENSVTHDRIDSATVSKLEEAWSEFTSTLYAFEGELDLSDVSETEDPTIVEDGEFACQGIARVKGVCCKVNGVCFQGNGGLFIMLK